MTTEERNVLVMEHIGAVRWTIRRNRALIQSARLDQEDVFQQLTVRMIQAIDHYDADKGSLSQHIFAQLQYELLNCKAGARISGIHGAPYHARNLVVSLDATGYQAPHIKPSRARPSPVKAGTAPSEEGARRSFLRKEAAV